MDGSNDWAGKIRTVLDALLRDDPYEAYDLLTVMLGDAQYLRDYEEWGEPSLGRDGPEEPKRSDYPKPEPRTETN